MHFLGVGSLYSSIFFFNDDNLTYPKLRRFNYKLGQIECFTFFIFRAMLHIAIDLSEHIFRIFNNRGTLYI